MHVTFGRYSNQIAADLLAEEGFDGLFMGNSFDKKRAKQKPIWLVGDKQRKYFISTIVE